jgi:hypothetical protein
MPTSMGSLITPWRDFFSAATSFNKMRSQEHYHTCSGRCSWDPRQQSAALRQHRAQCLLINTLMREYHLSKTSIYRYLRDIDAVPSSQWARLSKPWNVPFWRGGQKTPVSCC